MRQVDRTKFSDSHRPATASTSFAEKPGTIVVDTASHHRYLIRENGTSEPWMIGTDVSTQCIRMLKEDVIELYDRVRNGAG